VRSWLTRRPPVCSSRFTPTATDSAQGWLWRDDRCVHGGASRPVGGGRGARSCGSMRGGVCVGGQLPADERPRVVERVGDLIPAVQARILLYTTTALLRRTTWCAYGQRRDDSVSNTASTLAGSAVVFPSPLPRTSVCLEPRSYSRVCPRSGVAWPARVGCGLSLQRD